VGARLLPGVAHAQLGPQERCQNLTTGIVLTMKIFRDVGQTREVALDQVGFEPGSARSQIADQVYRQLETGVAPELVMQRARTECMRVGPDSLEPDEPTDEPEDLPVCGDVASMLAANIFENPRVRTGPLDEALDAVRSSDPREMETPETRRLLLLGRDRAARGGIDQQGLQETLFRECTSLEPERRTQLLRATASTAVPTGGRTRARSRRPRHAASRAYARRPRPDRRKSLKSSRLRQ
jgi:hypothetical protein